MHSNITPHSKPKDSSTTLSLFCNLFPPYLLILIFFPTLAGLMLNADLVSVQEPLLTLCFILILLILRLLSGQNIFYFIALALVFANSFVLLSHWIMLKGPMTSNSLFVVFNTNYEEAMGFLYQKRGYEYWLHLPYFICGLLALIYTFKPQRGERTYKYKVSAAMLILAMCFLTFRYTKGGYRYATPILARSSLLFYKDIQLFAKLKAERHQRSATIDATLSFPDIPSVVVLIEGESLNRNHMSLYDYYRETNPELQHRQDLIVFSDVVSGYHSTMTSITGALTESNLDNKRPAYDCYNILDICRAADVKTYWLSNQSPLGFLENIITLMAQQADKSVFLNHTSGLSLTENEFPSYDNVLFPALHKAMQDSGKHKFIVLHLIGSHGRYDQRYPAKFARFDGKTKITSTIANYDNSVLYNDFVIDSLLNIVQHYARRDSTASAVVYVSDHGENVYDDADYAGHDYSDSIYNSIVEIPFLVYLSPEYHNFFPEKAAAIQHNQHLPYMTDDLFYSLIDLLNIETDVMKESRSIFNASYNAERPRMLYDGRNYDMVRHYSNPLTVTLTQND